VLFGWVRAHFFRTGRGVAILGSPWVRVLPSGCPVLLCLVLLVPAALGSTASGPVVSWGDYFGGGGDVVPPDQCSAVCAGGYHGLAIRSDGSLAVWGDSTKEQCSVPPGRGFIAIAAGLYHSLALKSDGSLLAWGDNSRGQCQVPTGGRYRAIAAGHWHSLAIRSDGSLVAWGWNDYGQCNVPPGNGFVAVSAGQSHSLALKTNKSIVAWGNNGDRQCQVPAGKDFIRIAAGSVHNVALRSNGTIAAWGRNDEGQCNAPADADFTAIAAGTVHSLALKRDGRIVAWGPKEYDQRNVPSEGRFTAVAAGGSHSLAICDSRTKVAQRDHAVAVAAGEPSVMEKIETKPEAKNPGLSPLSSRRNPTVRQRDSSDRPGPTARVPQTQAATAAKPSVVAEHPAPTPQSKDIGASAEAASLSEPNAIKHATQSTPTTKAPSTPPQPPAKPDGGAVRPACAGDKPPQAVEPQAPSAEQTRTPPAVEPNHVTGGPAGGDKSQTGAAPVRQPDARVEPDMPFNPASLSEENVAADSSIRVDANTVPVYHFISVTTRQHLYTISDTEKYEFINSQSDSWKYQGIAFFAYPPGRQPPAARPVYHFRSDSLGQHFYTTSESRKEALVRKYAHLWKYEGVAWYAPPAKPSAKK